MNIGFIGLGVMGFPMAGIYIKNNNLNLNVYNRSLNKTESWIAKFKGNLTNLLQKQLKSECIYV